jgi:hypothetical protein
MCILVSNSDSSTYMSKFKSTKLSPGKKYKWNFLSKTHTVWKLHINCLTVCQSNLNASLWSIGNI